MHEYPDPIIDWHMPPFWHGIVAQPLAAGGGAGTGPQPTAHALQDGVRVRKHIIIVQVIGDVTSLREQVLQPSNHCVQPLGALAGLGVVGEGGGRAAITWQLEPVKPGWHVQL